ncbi:MAG: hypothetical protein DWQ30_04785 [Acidobacteria bacterium]|nr:MAG: hypothetical protein DWQ30_04785 [Acidobacteriota bacterium]
MPTHSPPPAPPQSRDDYDVVIVGAGFCGASAATLLRRAVPGCRVLLIDRNRTTTHKVGEATVEVSARFMTDVLGIGEHLRTCQLPKHGLRFWFTDARGRRLEEMSEIGPAAAPPLSTFQLDRSVLDEHIVSQAVEAGAELVRPATVRSWDEGWPRQAISLSDADGQMRTVTCRWLLDASGRAAFVARRKRLLERTDDHPTNAVWARWEGVHDLDGPAFVGSPDGSGADSGADSGREGSPRLRPLRARRRLATNHFCGRGWWCWMIPLACGRTSVGLVWDSTLFDLPGEGDVQQRYQQFVRRQDGLRELLEGAHPVEGDVMAYRHLPYRSRRFADRGWLLLGDAGMFLDPFYSPGLDQASISTFSAVQVVRDDLMRQASRAGSAAPGNDGDPASEEELDAALTSHDRRFDRSYRRWLEALYLGKYRLMGDAELATTAFLVDTALYYLGVVGPVYRHVDAFANPVFGLDLPQSTWSYRSMRWFSRRLQRLAEVRRRQGTYGRRNLGWRPRVVTFRLGPPALRPLAQGIAYWMRMEGSALLHSVVGRRRPATAPAATDVSSPPDESRRVA